MTGGDRRMPIGAGLPGALPDGPRAPAILDAPRTRTRRSAPCGSLLAAFLLAACGFSPALAPPSGGPLPAYRLAEPADRNGFLYAAALEDRLGPADPGAPRLDYSIAVTQAVIAVSQRENARRVQETGSVSWRVTDAAGGVIASGTEEGFTAWSATGTTLSVRASERDAEERLMRLLADRTVTALIAAR